MKIKNNMEATEMVKFSTGLFAGAVIGMAVAMLDRRSMKRAKKMARRVAHNISCCSM